MNGIFINETEKIRVLREMGYDIVNIPMVKHPKSNELISVNEMYNTVNTIDYFELKDIINGVVAKTK